MGPAWQRVTEPDGTPGQWYLHTFAPEQPDFNWRHPDVAAHFEKVLRFWFDRGVDGLRIDVAHGLHKRRGLPDHEHAEHDELTGDPVNPHAWNQPEVHEVWRSWRAIATSTPRGPAASGSWSARSASWTPQQLAEYQRPDELHQTFFFEFLRADWDDRGAARRRSTAGSGRSPASGSTVTWVLNNHDMPRSVTRYAGGAPGADPATSTSASPGPARRRC